MSVQMAKIKPGLRMVPVLESPLCPLSISPGFSSFYSSLVQYGTWMAQMMCDRPLGYLNRAVSAALPIRHWSSQRGKFLLLVEVSDKRRWEMQRSVLHRGCREGDEGHRGGFAASCSKNALQCSNIGAIPARLLVNLQPSTTHLIKSLLLQL